LELATKIRAEREQELKESMLGYRLRKDRNVNFLDYFQSCNRVGKGNLTLSLSRNRT
jgi:hypothetical protein